ncbi:MAG: hypothetical protein PHX61_08195 [Alphaproteobacteria bacterium]|nr:hypothetical protein [Alphaproteobacteria bacterium]
MAMTLQEAYKKAREQAADLILSDCVELPDRWAFYFVPKDDEATGQPYFTIHKRTGALDYLTIPPLENLKKLQGGKKIPINTIVD